MSAAEPVGGAAEPGDVEPGLWAGGWIDQRPRAPLRGLSADLADPNAELGDPSAELGGLNAELGELGGGLAVAGPLPRFSVL
ncbi:hypothetical protein ABZ639_26200 [Saccharomonospora sp. NPDC006951]